MRFAVPAFATIDAPRVFSLPLPEHGTTLTFSAIPTYKAVLALCTSSQRLLQLWATETHC